MRGLYRLYLASTSLSLSAFMLISCESVSHGEARIFRAIEEGNVELTLYLVKKGQLEATKANGASPLMMAALAGDFELVKMLVEHGADIMHRDRKGCTTLQRLSFLCSRSKENLVKQAEQLREFGFPEEAIARIISSSALPKQAEEKLEKFQKIIRYLNDVLDSRVDVLGKAIEADDVDRVKELVLYSPLDKLGSHGRSPLMDAALHGNIDIVEILLNAGASISTRDNFGFNVVDYLKIMLIMAENSWKPMKDNHVIAQKQMLWYSQIVKEFGKPSHERQLHYQRILKLIISHKQASPPSGSKLN